MRIVYICKALAITGGLERIIIDKMNYFAEKSGYEVHIITCEQGNHPIVFPLSSKVKHTDLNVRFFTIYRYNLIKRAFLYPSMKQRYRQLLKKEILHIKPDIILGTTFALEDAKFLSNISPTSVTIIESHIAKTSTGAHCRFKPNSLQYHILYIYDQICLKNFKKCDALVTLTHNDAQEWETITKPYVIPNILTYYPDTTSLKNNKRIISSGRLEDQKGYDMLIKAWSIVTRKHPDWIIDIYGDGSKKDILLKEIEMHGLQESFIIHQPTSHIYDKYQESAFYVMSSRMEGFGLVLAEAMSCGIPCISFDCPHGPSDIIRDNEDGFLVEKGNIEQLAEKICYLIEHEDIRKEMGIKARENIKRYLPQNIMPQWEELFQTLIKKKQNK